MCVYRKNDYLTYPKTKKNIIFKSNKNKKEFKMTIIAAIFAIICVCFGLCQIMGGYAVGSGFAAIVIGVVIAAQGCFHVVEVIPMV